MDRFPRSLVFCTGSFSFYLVFRGHAWSLALVLITVCSPGSHGCLVAFYLWSQLTGSFIFIVSSRTLCSRLRWMDRSSLRIALVFSFVFCVFVFLGSRSWIAFCLWIFLSHVLFLHSFYTRSGFSVTHTGWVTPDFARLRSFTHRFLVRSFMGHAVTRTPHLVTVLDFHFHTVTFTPGLRSFHTVHVTGPGLSRRSHFFSWSRTFSHGWFFGSARARIYTHTRCLDTHGRSLGLHLLTHSRTRTRMVRTWFSDHVHVSWMHWISFTFYTPRSLWIHTLTYVPGSVCLRLRLHLPLAPRTPFRFTLFYVFLDRLDGSRSRSLHVHRLVAFWMVWITAHWFGFFHMVLHVWFHSLQFVCSPGCWTHAFAFRMDSRSRLSFTHVRTFSRTWMLVFFWITRIYGSLHSCYARLHSARLRFTFCTRFTTYSGSLLSRFHGWMRTGCADHTLSHVCTPLSRSCARLQVLHTASSHLGFCVHLTSAVFTLTAFSFCTLCARLLRFLRSTFFSRRLFHFPGSRSLWIVIVLFARMDHVYTGLDRCRSLPLSRSALSFHAHSGSDSFGWMVCAGSFAFRSFSLDLTFCVLL